MLRFEFICADHPEEVLDYAVWSEGDPVQITIQSCELCFKDLTDDYKEKIKRELTEQIKADLISKLKEV